MSKALLHAFQVLFEWLLDLGTVAWLCIFPLACSIVAFVFFVPVPEGRELLRILIQNWNQGGRGIASMILYFCSTAGLALGVWYSARVLVSHSFPKAKTKSRATSPSALMVNVRTWLPRVLAFIVLLPAVMFSRLAGDDWYYSAAGAAVAVLVLGFILFRRRLFPSYFPLAEGEAGDSGGSRRKAGSTQRPDLDRSAKVAIAVWAVAASALFLGFTVAPVTVPRWFGTGPVVLIALMLWTIFGSFVLVLWPKTYGLPSMAFYLPVTLVVVSSCSNDNHAPRVAEKTVSFPDRRLELNRPVDEYFDRWIEARHLSGGTYPVFIVTAEGGGLRAAYWTASVLGRLQDKWPGTTDRFSDHVFAISGVSGGSLGAAVFTGLVAETEKGFKVRDPHDGCLGVGYAELGRCILDDDFLSPIVAAFLFSDLVQQFVPWPMHWADRARALELSWEDSWTQVTRSAAFGAQYEELWRKPGETAFTANYNVPSLLINGTVVEDGRRIIFSNLQVQDQFVDAYDGTDPVAALALPGKDPFRSTAEIPPLPLSTAVHMGARFTYLSPAARLDRYANEEDWPCKPHECLWGRVVDGGYHENSGAETAHDVLQVVLDQMKQPQNAHVRIVPYLIMITNDPEEPPVTRTQETSSDDDYTTRIKHAAGSLLPEFLSPVNTLLAVREARSPYARSVIARVMRRAIAESDAHAPDPVHAFEFYLERKTSNPALGWVLSGRANESMDLALMAPRHQAQIEDIAALAPGQTPPRREESPAP
jgi:hypothetical protein